METRPIWFETKTGDVYRAVLYCRLPRLCYPSTPAASISSPSDSSQLLRPRKGLCCATHEGNFLAHREGQRNLLFRRIPQVNSLYLHSALRIYKQPNYGSTGRLRT